MMPIQYDKVKLYVESILGVTAHLKPVNLKLPYHIQDSYQLVEAQILVGTASVIILLLLPASEEYPGAVALGKHVSQVRKATDAVIVYVCKSLTKFERRSLIKHHINFIQPGYQMFIPELAMDLREKVRERRDEQDVSSLLPAAQAMLLRCLYKGWAPDSHFQASAIMGDLKYSRVTLSKVVDQLQKLKLLRPINSRSPRNIYALGSSSVEVFREARNHLRSPVRRRVAIDTKICLGDGAFLAGETALAKYSMLAEPGQPTYGMTKERFAEMVKAGAFRVTDSVDDRVAWVEIWAYHPLKTATNLPDEASLLLSLEDNPDERIQIALGELRKQVEWLASVHPSH